MSKEISEYGPEIEPIKQTNLVTPPPLGHSTSECLCVWEADGMGWHSQCPYHGHLALLPAWFWKE